MLAFFYFFVEIILYQSKKSKQVNNSKSKNLNNLKLIIDNNARITQLKPKKDCSESYSRKSR